jgi:hypothetical protein
VLSPQIIADPPQLCDIDLAVFEFQGQTWN